MKAGEVLTDLFPETDAGGFEESETADNYQRLSRTGEEHVHARAPDEVANTRCGLGAATCRTYKRDNHQVGFATLERIDGLNAPGRPMFSEQAHEDVLLAQIWSE